MEAFVFAIFLGLIPAFIARSKGHSFFKWWFYGVMLFIVVIFYVIFWLPDKSNEKHISKHCPQCNFAIDPGAAVCEICGFEMQSHANNQSGGIVKNGLIILIDCAACSSLKSMESTQIPRFGGIVRVIGYVLTIPSIIGVFFAVLMLVSVFMSTGEVMGSAQSDPERTGSAIGFTIGAGMALSIGIGSLVGGLIGWLLIMKKKVFKCVHCGYVMDRA